MSLSQAVDCDVKRCTLNKQCKPFVLMITRFVGWEDRRYRTESDEGNGDSVHIDRILMLLRAVYCQGQRRRLNDEENALTNEVRWMGGNEDEERNAMSTRVGR